MKTLSLEEKIDQILTNQEVIINELEDVKTQQESIIEALNNLSRDGGEFGIEG